MHYSSSMDYQFGFECHSHEGGHHIGVVYEAEKPEIITCLYDPRKPQAVELRGRYVVTADVLLNEYYYFYY